MYTFHGMPPRRSEDCAARKKRCSAELRTALETSGRRLRSQAGAGGHLPWVRESGLGGRTGRVSFQENAPLISLTISGISGEIPFSATGSGRRLTEPIPYRPGRPAEGSRRVTVRRTGSRRKGRQIRADAPGKGAGSAPWRHSRGFQNAMAQRRQGRRANHWPARSWNQESGFRVRESGTSYLHEPCRLNPAAAGARPAGTDGRNDDGARGGHYPRPRRMKIDFTHDSLAAEWILIHCRGPRGVGRAAPAGRARR